MATATTPSDGAHTAQIANPPLHTGGTNWYGQASAGAHTHDLTLTYEPEYRQLRLIKSNTILKEFPQDGVVFGKSDLSSYATNLWSGDNKLFKAGAALATGGTAPAGGALPAPSVSSSGSHVHGTACATTNPDYIEHCYSTPAAGNHSDHICSALLQTDSVKKAILTAWGDASSAFNLATGMIVMYEGVTAPMGWGICDGTLGTLDFRDYFVYIGTTGTHGTKSGTNAITVDITIGESSWIHTHQTGTGLEKSPPIDNTQHSTSDPSVTAHDHAGAMVGTSLAYVPAYYALTFIMKV